VPTFRQTVTFRDDKGQTATTRFFVTAADEDTANPLAQDIVDAMAALTNASLDSASGAYTRPPAPHTYGANAQYERIEDKAVLVYQTEAGQLHRYRIPAPKIAIFLADGETVDTGNADVGTLNDAMLAAACSGDGVAIDTFIGGVLGRSKMQRRYNIFTKNPALTGPGL